MEHLFKLLNLITLFYFFSWIEKANRDSKFFPIFTILLDLHHPLCSFSPCLDSFFSPIFNILLEMWRHQVLGHLAIITTYCFFQFLVNLYLFQKMLRLRRELGSLKVESIDLYW